MLTATINDNVLRELSLMSNDELKNRSVVFRKLSGRGYHGAAFQIYTMQRSDYECLITNTCDELEG
jgi:hypothetical protein